MMRIPSGEPDLEDEWDPQGLNSLAKDELESFSMEEDEEEEHDEDVVSLDELSAEEEHEDDDSAATDLDRDGLIELEEMEMSLLAEESPLDFAMVGEED